MNRPLRCLAVPLFLVASPAPAQNPPAPQPLGTVAGFSDWVTDLAFSPDGSILAAGTYDEVRLIDPATRNVTRTLNTAKGYVQALAFSSEGTRLFVGEYQSLTLWNAADATFVRSFDGHTGYVTALALTPDRLVSASDDGTIRLWHLDSGRNERTIDLQVPVNDVALSPDGALLAAAAGDPTRPNRPGPVSLWNLATGEKLADLVGHERAALAVSFSPDGTRLASAGEDEKVNLYDVPSRKPIGFYAGHSRSVNDVAFLAAGRLLASVSGGNAGGLCELRLWSPDGTDLAAAEPHEQRITALAVSPDGRTLALASHDKTVSLWNVSSIVDPADRAARPPLEAPRPAAPSLRPPRPLR